jgi:hypothetical protein
MVRARRHARLARLTVARLDRADRRQARPVQAVAGRGPAVQREVVGRDLQALGQRVEDDRHLRAGARRARGGDATVAVPVDARRGEDPADDRDGADRARDDERAARVAAHARAGGDRRARIGGERLRARGGVVRRGLGARGGLPRVVALGLQRRRGGARLHESRPGRAQLVLERVGIGAGGRGGDGARRQRQRSGRAHDGLRQRQRAAGELERQRLGAAGDREAQRQLRFAGVRRGGQRPLPAFARPVDADDELRVRGVLGVDVVAQRQRHADERRAGADVDALAADHAALAVRGGWIGVG